MLEDKGEYKIDERFFNGYNFSKDYNLLYELILQGKRIIILALDCQEDWSLELKLGFTYLESNEISSSLFEWNRFVIPFNNKEFIDFCKNEKVSFLIP